METGLFILLNLFWRALEPSPAREARRARKQYARDVMSGKERI